MTDLKSLTVEERMDLRFDRNADLGPEWVWDRTRGENGCWCLLSEYELLPLRVVEDIKSAMAPHLVPADMAPDEEDCFRRIDANPEPPWFVVLRRVLGRR